MPSQRSTQPRFQARTQTGADKIHMVTTHDSTGSDSDDEYVFTISALPGSSVPTADVEINGCKVKVLIDTGASADVIDEAAFAIIQGQQQTHLEQDGSKIFAYGAQSQLMVVGKFKATVSANKKKDVIHFSRAEGQSWLSSELWHCTRTRSCRHQSPQYSHRTSPAQSETTVSKCF